MRRKDREMPEDFALGVVDKCEWAVISMITPDNKPYCVAVSIARSGKDIWFHCATNGKKTDCLRNNPDVCVSFVGDMILSISLYTFRSNFLDKSKVMV